MPLGGQTIPVNRDDVEGIPPALGVETRSLGRAPGRASTALPGNSDKAIVRHRLIVAETYHELSDDFPDQPGLIALIGINGGVEPFHFIAFHGGRYGD